MIDVNDILKNDAVKGVLDQFGVTEEQAKSVAGTAVDSIKNKFQKDPKQMSSLLSENENTDADNAMAKEVEDDFLDGLIKKVGLPENVADQIKGALPGIMNTVTSKLSADGQNNEGGIAGMLGNITEMFDGDDNDSAGDVKKSSGGIGGLIGKFFGK
ncbi:MAG: hypothetical protein MK105_04285 [Crocinitomicaceae bacterium]|nr:hypothetical protein [Crocinitomicaceae bacterium]